MLEEGSLVSIIVPVYNAEEYLSNCIESILNQTYKNIEIILIDDGSTDKSLFICNEYKKIDNRINVVQQSNSGPSVARNRGIAVSTGSCIQFVDSDDSLDSKMTHSLVEILSKNKAELVLCGYNTLDVSYNKTNIKSSIPDIHGLFDKNEILDIFGQLYTKDFINPLWNKLYVRELITNNNIKFVEHVNMGEDLLFNLDYITYCSSIYALKEPLYNYLTFNNANSLTANYENEKFEKQQLLFQKVREFLTHNHRYVGENINYVEVAYTNSVISCLDNLFHKNSRLSSKNIKVNISSIIRNERVQENVIYFNHGNIQKRLIGYLIKINFILGIHCFFKTKKVLRGRLKLIINFFKR